MTFANAILNNQVGDLLAEQFAGSKGITISSRRPGHGQVRLRVHPRRRDQRRRAAGIDVGDPLVLPGRHRCQHHRQGAAGRPARPPSGRPRSATRPSTRSCWPGGPICPTAAVAKFYNANLDQFTTACVSLIATDTQAHANQLVAQLNAGESFASVAKANSLDTQTAANGGALGCNYTQAQVEQALSVQSVTVGQPLAPVQDPSNGQWVIYEVTSQTVAPLSAASTVARRELLQSTANVNRVSKEIVAFARTSDVSVDPQYGTWLGLRVVPPVAPPSQFLLGAVAGQAPLVKRTSSGA